MNRYDVSRFQNADQTAKLLVDITSVVTQVNDLVDGISAASLEQNNGIVEINKGLSQVNHVVQENSSISEQTSAAVENLSDHALQLQSTIKNFINDKEVMAQPKNNTSFDEPLNHESFGGFSKGIIPEIASQSELKPNPAMLRKTIVLDDSEFGKY